MTASSKTSKTSKTILLLGSSGFIGQQVRLRLAAAGGLLRLPQRQQIDFTNLDMSSIASLLQGVDVIINMVGIMSQNNTLLEQVHHHAPRQIAALAKQAGVSHWINLSALGAAASHKVAFVGSKGRGDAALGQLADDNFQVSVVRPSLVFGRGGASCELFIKLARLPVLAMPKAGGYSIQPVHVDDVAQGLTNLALGSAFNAAATTIPFTGAEVCTVAQYIRMLRQNIYQQRTLTVLSVPMNVAKVGVTILSCCTDNMISLDSLTLLTEGSIASNQKFTELLGRSPLGYQSFINR
ncbi:epimerase [Psychrobacter pygoscelis]|uniref:epimerase n=1 Tax=Psychrobacter pygoscelis TaxID=2488563 RepID=UPI00103BF858|nr:epimerase [Psychrobacter pygoscelis]